MFLGSTDSVMSASCKSSCKVVKYLKHNEKAIRFCAQSSVKLCLLDVNSGWKSTSSMWISDESQLNYIKHGKQNTNYIAFQNQTNLHNQNHLQ